MKTRKLLLFTLCLLASAALSQTQAQTPAQTPAPLPRADQYSAKGADTCLECHDDENAAYSAKAMFKGKHAHRGVKRTPFGAGQLQCESCHGPGALHARNKKAASIISFKPDSKATLAQRNQTCLGCHEGGTRSAWHAGAHDAGKLACTDCHKLHQPRDLVLAKASEAQVCLACHKSQRADFHKASTHPVLKGVMACSDCHAPHGSSAPGMLTKATVNQTCFSCHADKRGPLLWEHQPVAEDCSLCHAPHGSVRAALLTKTSPLLCQSCHSASGHPAVPRTSNSLLGSGNSGSSGGAAFVVAGGCANCHTKVHGSNHPSGAKLLR